MKATEANLLKFIRKSPQFMIPIYQRIYSWTTEQCKQLWNDLISAGRDEKVNAHFLGSIVYVERGLGAVIAPESLLVIDGQQRLTTCTLLILALARHFREKCLEELLDIFSEKKLVSYYLLNQEEKDERHFKLILSEADKDTLLALLKETPMPAEHSIRILQNYDRFKDYIRSHQSELDAICKGLAKLVIVEVALDRTHDNPQLIFESMNSTGLDLSQADLIRNYILMGLDPSIQTQLYKTYWRPMEQGFGQAAYAVHFDAFMRHYLIAKTGEIPNIREVYSAFKQFAQRSQPNVQSLVSDIHAYAKHYCAMALGAESHSELKKAFQDLHELKVDVAYPFLLEVYDDYERKHLTAEDFLKIVRLVESFVFRRAVCAIPTNSLNKIFAGLGGAIRKDRYLESIQAALLLLPSYRRFPDDKEFKRQLMERDLYNFRSRSYWLRKLENLNRKELVIVEDYTIEHIMPQNRNLSEFWQIELGAGWRSIHERWLHTLGNLTLSAYNREYSDLIFQKKRDLKNKKGEPIGLSSSPLWLNDGLGSTEKWDLAAIKSRAERLAERAIVAWSIPKLDEDVLQTYVTNLGGDKTYTKNDHPHLLSGSVEQLFNLLRQQILLIDPCITEVFLKHYVAYKAETNFVDVVPQAKQLNLSLNMPFNEIEDPKGFTRDLTGKGHLGNGDIEISLSSEDDLTYVIGLIRQALEHQMGESAE